MVACVVFAILLPFKSLHQGDWVQPSVFFLIITLWSILLVGAFAYVAMGWAAKRVGATAVMLFMLLQAILTVVGGLMIIVGILIFVLGPIMSFDIQSKREQAMEL